MRHRLYVHVTWTTRGREPSIGADAAYILQRYLPSVARQERARIVELGIVSTHVHVLLGLDPSTSIPRLLQRLKGGSSVLVNRELGTTVRGTLRWAKGYNLESVSVRAVPAVTAYVRDQNLRHPSEAISLGPRSRHAIKYTSL